jgi:hypothetical protein
MSYSRKLFKEFRSTCTKSNVYNVFGEAPGIIRTWVLYSHFSEWRYWAYSQGWDQYYWLEYKLTIYWYWSLLEGLLVLKVGSDFFSSIPIKIDYWVLEQLNIDSKSRTVGQTHRLQTTESLGTFVLCWKNWLKSKDKMNRSCIQPKVCLKYSNI